MFLRKLRDFFAAPATSIPDVAIFSEGAAYSLTFLPVVEEMCRRNMPCTYLTLDDQDPVLALSSSNLSKKCVGKGVMGLARVAAQPARIMLATTPNIGCKGYPLMRPKGVECLAHVYHGVMDLTYYKKGALDYYDASLEVGHWCAANTQKVAAMRGLPAKECVPVGLPCLDSLAKNVVVREMAGDPPCILYAPSWGEKSSLVVHGLGIVHDILAAGFRLIVRPHPQSWHFDRDLMRQLQDLAATMGNFELDSAVDATASLQEADVLVSESSGIRFDYAFLYHRPVITLEMPSDCLKNFEADTVGASWEKDMVHQLGAVVPLGSRPEWGELVAGLLAKPKSDFQHLHDELVVNHGTAASGIADWITDKLARMKQG